MRSLSISVRRGHYCIIFFYFNIYSLHIRLVMATVIGVIYISATASKNDFYCPAAQNGRNTSAQMLTRWRGSADGSAMALPGVWISRRLTSLAELLFSSEQKCSVATYAGGHQRGIEPSRFTLIKQNTWTNKKLNMGLISQQSGGKRSANVHSKPARCDLELQKSVFL